MSAPEVSVVLAVKNESKYIKSAVESILAQRGVSIEVVVVDDASSDDTVAIVRSMMPGDSRLRFSQNSSSGKCSAFNLGVSLATGRFVCIFAGDDLMPVGSLSARYAMVRSEPADMPVVGLCKIISMSTDKRFDGAMIPRKPGRGAMSGVSPLMNRLALHRIFPVPESLPNEDTWMELAISHFRGWRVIHSDIIGCRWRVHEGNSINMMMPYPEYHRRIAARVNAVPMFYERFGMELSDASQAELRAKITCEKARLRGDLIGILASPVGMVDKLRRLSQANAFLYGLRQRLYGLLSGW